MARSELTPGTTATEAPAEAALLAEVLELATAHLASLAGGPVAPRTPPGVLRERLGAPLPDTPQEPARVVRELAAGAEGGLTLMPSGRFFGFVIGGTLPAALAADWLTTVWDQNAGLYAPTPAAAIVEEIAGAHLLDLLGLPAGASFALVTGAQMAHVTCLAAARNHVLAAAGWDVERRGLIGGPPVRVLAGAQRHATIDRALRLIGLGTGCVELVEADTPGRMLPDALAGRLAGGAAGTPTIVCAQAGEVNTGAFDDLTEIIPAARAAGAWVHVDGAFGLWAAASPRLRHLVAGVDQADSWTTDCHKWLNVPYDCGVAVCAHPAAHRAAMTTHADYLVHSDAGGPRDPVDFTPEFSRRARGFPVYAALRSLGRSGVADLVDRSCAHARRFAEQLAAAPGVTVLNQVVLNQVLVGFAHPRGGDGDAHTRSVIDRVQRSGVCYPSGTSWGGHAAMRISVSNWRTTTDDVDRSVAAILAAARVAADA